MSPFYNTTLAFLFLVFFTQIGSGQTFGPDNQYVEVNLDADAGPLSLELCGLEPGKEYSIQLKGNEPMRKPVAIALEGGIPLDEGIIPYSFMALKECVQLTIQLAPLLPGMNNPAGYSYDCRTCSESEGDRSVSVWFLELNSLVNFILMYGAGCWDIRNLTAQGMGESLGAFVGPPGPPGFGMVMSTGISIAANGQNNSMNVGTDFGLMGDLDMTALIPGNPTTFDLSKVEFDFTAPYTGFLVYNIVFASEEYPERTVCDGFGIFVSGPGILGQYSGGAANFAVIPNTNWPINACTISPTMNDKMYIDNFEGKDTQYDGYTEVIQVRIPIQECEDYHIKFAIADSEDGIYDSAVFIGGNSFASEKITTIETMVPSTGTNVAFEECNDAFFRICKNNQEDLIFDILVDYTVSPASTATWGVDYSALPPSFFIPSGVMCVDVPVTILGDQIQEGDETLIIELVSACECVSPNAELIITEAPLLEIGLEDISICQDEVLFHGPEIISGVPNYTYNWSDGSTGAQLDFFAETFGTTLYKVTVTDQCGRVAVDSAWVDIQPRPTATMEGDGTVCVGSTKDTVFVTITLSPPVSAPWGLSYYLNGVLQPVLTNLTQSVITIPVTSPGYNEILGVWNNTVCLGYTYGSSFIEGILVEADIDTVGVSCFGADDGKITVVGKGGIIPYNYAWNVPGKTGPVLDSLGVGEYIVTVTDDFGCAFIDTVVFDSQTDIVLVGNLVKGADCLTSNGEVELEVTGGSLPYSFLWNNGSTSQNPTNLPEGTATVTVTDGKGCESYASFDIPAPEAPSITIEAVGGVTCLTPAGGQALLDVSGGSMPYTFQWSGNGGTQQNPTGLTGGTYTVTVTDFAGCEIIGTVDIPIDTISPVAQAIPEHTLFCGATSLFLNGSGSSVGPEFVYSWTTMNGQVLMGGDSLKPQIGLPGIYTLLVTNSQNGCTASTNVIVHADVNAPVIQYTPADTLTCLVNTVTLDASGSSSGPNFNIFWFTANGVIVSGGNTLTPTVSAPGTYRLILTNLLTDCAVILELTVVELNPTMEAIIASPELITCTDPQITLDGLGSTIVPGTNFQWSTTNGSIIGSSGTPTIQVDAAGEYILIVTDPQSGCADTVSVLVSADQNYPMATIVPTNEISCLVTSVNLVGSGSSQGPNFTYEWTTTNGNITGSTQTVNTTASAGGVYSLIVTNTDNGCSSVSTIFVASDTISPVITAGANDQIDCLNSEVTLQGSGQTSSGSATISWSTTNGNILSGMNTYTPQVNEVGTYELVVTDPENGCSSTSQVEVILNVTIPLVAIADPALITCASPEIMLDASGSDSGPDISVAWTTGNGSILSGENTVTPTINQAGMYTILVVNQDNGCRDSVTIEVMEDKVAPLADAGVPDQIVCLGDSALLDGSASSAGAEFSYQWFLDLNSPPIFENDIQAYTVLEGTYTLIVTNTVNGCRDSSQVTVAAAGTGIEIDLPFDVSISESEEVRLEATTNILPENIISITWDPPTGLDRIDSLVVFAQLNSTMVYTLTIVDDRGCIGMDTITVYYLDSDIYVPTAFTPYNNDGVNDFLMVFAGDIGIEEVELFEIFNRTGAMVYQAKNFQPNDAAFGWNGYHVGQKLNPGVLVYYAQVRFVDGRVKVLKGEILLLD